LPTTSGRFDRKGERITEYCVTCTGCL